MPDAVLQPLVGRTHEQAMLDRLADDAAAGASRFVAVWGEPGIGKTSLLGAVARRADERGFLVLEGRASEFERGLSFSVLIDALDAYLASLDRRAIERLAADGLAELATVFPSLRELAPDGRAAPAAAERFRLHLAVRELLERLAARQPVLIALDDLHWADGASLELASHLLRRPPRAGVLIAAALRTGQAPSAFAAAIEAAARDGAVEQLELGPLPPADAEQLMDGTDPALRAELYRESGGNPFYLEQLVRAGTGPLADGHRRGVTRAVAAAVQAELEGLSAAARTLVEAAAVAGDRFEIDLAAEIAAKQEHEALEALDELGRRGLIRPTEVPRRFRFRHPLVRHAVYEAIAPGSRLSFHGRAAAAVDGPAELRAHHVEASARSGDVESIALLSEAGRATAARDPATAARWFGAALRLLPRGHPPHERIELLTALAGAKAATGQFAAARSALLDALALVPVDDVAARVQLTAACAGVEHLLGRHRDAHARLVTALEELPDPGSPQAAALMIDLAVNALYQHDYDSPHDWGVRAAHIARGVGDRPLLAAASAVLALGSAFARTIPEALSWREEAAALVDAMPDDELARRADAAAHLAGAECYLDRYEAAIAHAERGLAVARASGQGDLYPMFVPAMAVARGARGELAEVAELLDGAIDSARLSGNVQGLAWGLTNRAWAAWLAGDIGLAIAMGEEGLALVGELDRGLLSVYAGTCFACAVHEAGDPARALDLWNDYAGGTELPLMPGGWRVFFLEPVAQAQLALGRRAEAERTAALAQEIAAATGLRLFDAVAQRLAAALALAAEQPEAAAKHALDAAARAEDCGGAVESARARVLAGRALIALGRRTEAIAELEQAESVAARCGAEGVQRDATRELRRLGRRRASRGPAHAGADGVGALTERELEIAELVTDRKTNKQIAAELFLSEKTVETHLRNIFFKLGVSSRVDVARAIEAARIRESP